MPFGFQLLRKRGDRELAIPAAAGNWLSISWHHGKPLKKGRRVTFGACRDFTERRL